MEELRKVEIILGRDGYSSHVIDISNNKEIPVLKIILEIDINNSRIAKIICPGLNGKIMEFGGNDPEGTETNHIIGNCDDVEENVYVENITCNDDSSIKTK